jgi:hypothetical protein
MDILTVLVYRNDIYSKRDSETLKTPLSIIDYAIMVIYFAVVIFLGFVASKKQSREGFLIADRNLRTFANSTSIVASKIGAGVLTPFLAMDL